MNKNRFQILLIGALIISNILLIVFISMPKKDHRFHPDKPRNIIIERLQFDEKQIEAYDVLIENHRNQIREKDQQIIELKNKLYENLNQDLNQNVLDSLTSEIASTQKQIETIHYLHFVDIKKLCKDDQLEKYNQLISELSRIFSPPRPPHKKK
jgi:protein CpxP